jgi:hypothetical protein
MNAFAGIEQGVDPKHLADELLAKCQICTSEFFPNAIANENRTSIACPHCHTVYHADAPHWYTYNGTPLMSCHGKEW